VSPEGTKRKLTAILSADVKGYSRLMEDDEEATVRTLTAYREVMGGLVEQHRGRVGSHPTAGWRFASASIWEMWW
jgi:class 3 adenylate cyclase